MEKAMKQIKMKSVAIATSTFAFAALLSIGWSEQGGVSLSVDSAQARVGRPLTPMSGAGVARRHYRRAGYGYGAGVVGAGALAAGTAAAVAATSPGWGGDPYYGGDQYDTGGPYAGGPYYGGGQGPGPYTQLHGRAVSPAGPALSSGQYLAGVGRPSGPYYGGGAWGARAYYAPPPAAPSTEVAPAWNLHTAYHAGGPWYGFGGWADYKERGGIGCDPGTVYRTEHGVHYICQ
jgi:hypothetical protein